MDSLYQLESLLESLLQSNTDNHVSESSIQRSINIDLSNSV